MTIPKFSTLVKIRRSIGFPGGSELNRSSEGPLQCAKMTVMDILEFRDMNGPAPMPKSGVMRSNMVRWAIFRVKAQTVLVLNVLYFAALSTQMYRQKRVKCKTYFW